MQGIVIASHGPMAKGILESSKLFMGEQNQLVACCLEANQSPDEFEDVLRGAIKEVDSGEGVFVLCDIPNGTPYNRMINIIAEDMSNESIQIVTGVNLPMVIQALVQRDFSTLKAEELINEGHNGITDLRETLKAVLAQNN